jgi:DNA-binding LytR/AlgR family response regulator
VGKAISYEEAIQMYKATSPGLVLLDIRLNGPKTGIDVANFIRQQVYMAPFIFLTSQLDRKSLEEAKATFPAGYLSKPVQKESLYTTIEIGLYSYQAQEEEKETIRLYNGKQYYQVPVEDILYLRADHNYVHIELANKKAVLQRSSMKEALDQLPDGQFVQTHRSYAVNLKKVSRWDAEYLYVKDDAIPISRGRRKDVIGMLQRG